MADNVDYTPGTGATIAADEIAGALHQRVKLSLGADGVAADAPGDGTDGLLVNLGANNDVTVTGAVTANAGTNLNTSALALEAGGNLAGVRAAVEATVILLDAAIAGNEMQVDVLTLPAPLATVGGGTEATALRVTLATDSSGVIGVDDNGGSLTVDGTVSISGTVTVAAHAVTNAGTFAVQESGAALTALQLIDNLVLAEDAAHASGDPGVQVLAVRKDTPTALAGTDADYIPLTTDALGRLHVAPQSAVRVAATPTISTGIYAIGDQYGSVMTFANAALANGGYGRIVNAVATNRDTETPLLELWLFRASPTMVNSDNGVFEITDANLESAELLGVVEFSAWWTNGSAGVVSQGVVRGMPLGGAPVYYTCGASATSIYGVCAIRNAVTQASTTDTVITLTLERW